MFFLTQLENKWVWVRDREGGITYEGYADSFSTTEEIAEIVLLQVKVYNYEDSLLLYQIPKIYLSLPMDRLLIEAPQERLEEK